MMGDYRPEMRMCQIGVIHAPYHKRAEAPRQGRSSSAMSEVEVFPEFAAGLDGMERCRYLHVLWWADQAERDLLRVIPPGETEERGVFCTRSPARPNPLGLSLVRVVEKTGNRIRVQWLDAVDGTPLVDLKPYSRGIDCVDDEKTIDC
ncbi:MAG: tRNA (N6-threonylcarbamoyladenosine(37)-N6)-methyltransferase TrmO [Methanomicrobiales archaeon]|nr:tRNA (N6-threonylcarbamoyladenosine(37)-N6)-methyltransferase TrmO [Methanomicrobiales archaeon]